MVKKLIFIWSKQIGLTALKTIYSLDRKTLLSVVTFDDSKDKRSRLAEFKDFSRQAGKKIHLLNTPSELESIILAENPDMCFVVGWYWIISEKILNKLPSGCLGIHASLLPKYRGFAPLVWSILNGDRESGVSLFYFDQGIDSGDIVAQKKFPIEDQDTINEAYQKAEEVSVSILKENYYLLLKGLAPRTKQDDKEATYYPKRTHDDGMIDWNKDNIEIHNAIRAQAYPYPGTFFLNTEGKKIYILKSGLPTQGYQGVPGSVVRVSDRCAVIACGRGAICLYELQPEGQGCITASKILACGTDLVKVF